MYMWDNENTDYEAVFVGTVIDIARYSDVHQYEVTFEVEQVVKGVSQDIVTITPGLGSYIKFFELGTKYKVYAFLNEYTSKIVTNQCTKTHMISASSFTIQHDDRITQGVLTNYGA